MTIAKRSIRYYYQLINKSSNGCTKMIPFQYSLNDICLDLQFIVINVFLMYIMSFGILDVWAMLIVSLINCNILTKRSLVGVYNTHVPIAEKISIKINKKLFYIVFTVLVFQFVLCSSYVNHPFTRNKLLEAILWSFITIISVITHNVICFFCKKLPTQSVRKLVLHKMTYKFMGDILPLGSLMIYAIYAPYICVFALLYHLVENVHDTILSGILFFASILMILIPILYYKLYMSLINQINRYNLN